MKTLGFRHTKITIEKMRQAKLGNKYHLGHHH